MSLISSIALSDIVRQAPSRTIGEDSDAEIWAGFAVVWAVMQPNVKLLGASTMPGYTGSMELERNAGRRTSVGIFVGFLAGLLWFFLSFAALFNGVFFLLLLFLPAYALSGALLVWFFRLPPVHAGFCLVGSALPWVAWLWPATISSSGWMKSLVWPVFVGTAFGLSLFGARLAAARRRRKSTQSDPALA